MKIQLKTTIAAVGAILFCAAPAIASAERVFFLVGTRHIFRIGTYQYAQVDQRMKIEQDYADQIASDQDIYKKAIADGADPAQESANLNAALDDLANERDKELGALYENVDYERARHPELQIQGDGPYQVMAINFHWRGDVEVFDNFYVYAPWPGYVVVGHPYGWNYGVIYTPYAFHQAYVGWYGGYVAMGSPAFVGIVGVGGPITFSIGIGIGGGPGYVPFVRHYGVAAPGFARSAYFHGAGPLATRSFNRPGSQGGFNRPGNNGGFNRGGSNGSGFNRGSNGPGGSGFNRGGSNTSSSSAGSRYSHSLGGSTNAGANRGSSNSTGGSRYSNSGSSHSDGPGSYRGTPGSSSGSRYSHSTNSSNPSGVNHSTGGSRYSNSKSNSATGPSKPSHSGDNSKGDSKDHGKG